MNGQTTRRGLLRLLLGAAAGGSTLAQHASRLYVITACPQPHSDLTFPGILFALGEDSHAVEWAAALLSPAQGVHFVLYSYEGRAACLAGPRDRPERIVVLYFDQPAQPRSLEVDLHGMTVVRRHLVRIGGRLSLAVYLASTSEKDFLSVPLEGAAARRLPPTELYADFAIDGANGGLVGTGDFAFLEQPAGSQRLFVAEVTPRFPSPIALPRGVSFLPNDLIRLSTCNESFLSLTSPETRVWKGADGYTPVWILERRRGIWQTVSVPGGLSGLRAFGPWLVAHVRYNLRAKPMRGELVFQDDSLFKRSPGEDARRSRLTATGVPFDLSAKSLDVYQPGLIWLYHVPTRRRIVEETGQGDTEVLWVEDGHVLYRCDRALYEARIDGTRLRNHRKLIERDFIADVHWVFYGPPSPPPPDPPWAAFKDYEK